MDNDNEARAILALLDICRISLVDRALEDAVPFQSGCRSRTAFGSSKKEEQRCIYDGVRCLHICSSAHMAASPYDANIFAELSSSVSEEVTLMFPRRHTDHVIDASIFARNFR